MPADEQTDLRPPIDDRSRDLAVELLRDVRSWNTSVARWRELDALVVTLLEAWDTQDAVLFRATTIRIEILNPNRTKEAGTAEPSKETRDRLNETIHKIGK